MKDTCFHLTTPQQNIWNLQRYYPDTAVSNLCGAVFYKERRREELLGRAINYVIRSQTGLRLRFSENSGQPEQYIKEYVYEEIGVHEFQTHEDFKIYALSLVTSPMKLTDNAMYRFEIIRIGETVGVLVMLSHLISDAWTFSLVGKGIDEAYRELAEGREPDGAIYDYTDCVNSEAAYAESPRYEKDRIFWQERFGTRPEITQITFHSPQTMGIEAKRYHRKLALSLARRIQDFSRETGITEAVLFETAFVAYLSRINPENKVISMGVPVLNRKNGKEKNTIGMLISTMPLTVEVSRDENILQLAKRITAEHGNLFRHQRYPYSRIVENVRKAHGFSGNLYEVMVSYQNAQIDSRSYTEWFPNGYSEVPLILHIDNRDKGDTYTITVDYQTEVFGQDEEISLIVDRVEHILGQITENRNLLIRDISILPDRERQKILLDFNDTAADYPEGKCVHELFMEQAEKTPERTALVFENKRFSYRELNEMSDSLAFLLRERGIGRGSIVAIIAKRSWHILVAMMGVLKAGGAYMPVSPDYPEDRIEHMLAISKADLVLRYGYEKKLAVESWDLSEIDFSCRRNKVDNLNRPGDLCYVIFTSGSTGLPKAVLISHENLANFISNNDKNRYQKELITTCKYVLAATTFVFDIFVFEIYLPLLNGLTVVMSNDIMNADEMAELIEKNHIDAFHTTPTKLCMLLQNRQFQKAIGNIKLLMVGAETFTYEKYQEISKYTNAVIYNGYGPTETTIGCSFKRIGQRSKDIKSDSDITIGKPISNTQIYILDEEYSLVPVGVAGQLCVAGAGVGKGYLNRNDLTAEKFVRNPFSTKENQHGNVMYCTGDFARWRADGEIEYLGRMDTQIKIRGLRVELGEIESVMDSFPQIRMSVAADKRSEDNRQYLVGYYLADSEINQKMLRQYLHSKLPIHMVPNYFVHLEEIPMTSSGKVDRKRLPLPDLDEQRMEVTEPITETERAVAAIWKEILHTDYIGRTDNFLEAGGDSLTAMSVQNSLEERFHVQISVRDIIGSLSLQQLAGIIDEAKEKIISIPSCHKDRYKLLPQQKAIYAVCSMNPATLAYNIPAKIKLPKTIDRERLKASIADVIDLHEALKTYIVMEDEEVYGIYDESAEIVFEEYAEENIWEFVRPFDLERAPLIHIGFVKNMLLLDIHHIIADGHSIGIILRDIASVYHGMTLKRNRVQYSDYAVYFMQKDLRKHKAYFKSLLQCEFEPINFPEYEKTGQTGGQSTDCYLPARIRSLVQRFANENNFTEMMVLLGAYGILLSKYTSKEEVLSSVILLNRTHHDVQNMVGMFVNTLPVCLYVKGEVLQYFARIEELVLNLFQYQELPFIELADSLGIKDRAAINTSFIYQGAGEAELFLDGEKAEIEPINTQSSKFDFFMEITPLEDTYRLRIEYNGEKYEKHFIERMYETYLQILSQLEKKRIADISMISSREQERLLLGFNKTAVKYPGEKCIHELFRGQAEKTPEKIALVFEHRKFSYMQLDQMSDTLAYLLRQEGIGANDVVPIIARRSWHIIVAMIGILKAGGAYMPVDPNYPLDRIVSMMELAGAKIALQYEYNKKLPIKMLNLGNIDYLSHTNFVENINRPDDICYVIFTSGSTGTPKGISVCHRNICNYTSNNSYNICQRIISDHCKSIASVTNIVFDIFVTESILPLLNGLCVYFANDDEAVSQEKLSSLFTKNHIDVLQTTPTKMKHFMSDKNNLSYLLGIKVIILGGEALQRGLYHELRSCTDALIYNVYGPAETTVWSTAAQVTDDDITIGRPIANTQIYILDRDDNPLPIGVPGELCIAGDGVGKGYLNRPELTAERFVPNPFATAENGHGKIMYHTGDLACWREDGEIRYLGRMDTQVKIRGLRIELGEIESAMNAIDGIRIAAVADKRSSDGRQYLAGYYVSGQEIDGRELRRQLSRRLPRYMVPNYFVRLEDMPMTPSGKIDRKNLPIPDFSLQAADYAEPETERERQLCGLLGKVLGIGQVGAEDDFFQLGGDSLKAIELAAKAHHAGIEISLQQVFDHPTARQLCQALEEKNSGGITYEASDFALYKPLLERNVIEEGFVPKRKTLGSVLLTGATGFLGAHILDVLMKEEAGRVYCLVRGREKEDGEQRLKERLRYYFGDCYREEFGKKIIPVSADMETENFQEKLPRDIQTIIHSAASVKHYGSYEYFYRTNVRGTEQVVDFAKSTGARLIHISTLSVSGNSMADEFSGYRSERELEFDETSFFVKQPLDNVYIRSKFEAEKAVFDAMLAGVEARIVRVGNLTNRASDYKFQPNYKENAFLKRVKAVLEFGMFPDYLLPLYAEFSPVDLTAQGVVKLAQYADKQCVFHLNSSRPVYFERLMEVLRELKIPMNVVPGDVFNRELQKTMKNAHTEYIFEALQNDMDKDGRLVYDSNIRINNDFTLWFLEQTGFWWEEIDREYLRGYIEYFRGLGYLEVGDEK